MTINHKLAPKQQAQEFMLTVAMEISRAQIAHEAVNLEDLVLRLSNILNGFIEISMLAALDEGVTPFLDSLVTGKEEGNGNLMAYLEENEKFVNLRNAVQRAHEARNPGHGDGTLG